MAEEFCKPKEKIILFKKEELALRCEWQQCEEVHSNMDSFMEHVDAHYGQNEGGTECQWVGCDYSSPVTQDFTRHIYYHAFHTKIKCLGSNIMYRKGNTLSCMIDSEERNSIPDLATDSVCKWDQCEETFNNVELFYRHVQLHVESLPRGNNPEGGVHCMWEECNMRFQSQHKVREHMRTHTQEKLAACPNCGSVFANRTKLVDHLQGQGPAKSKSFQCSYCSKSFTTERLLRNHTRQHVNHYKCPYCDMTCPLPSGLRSHVKFRHSKIKPFQCDICDYSCKTMNDLRRHTATHTEERIHSCLYPGCSFAARNKATVKDHLIREHQEGPKHRYVCHICSKGFLRGALLTTHLMKKHNYQWPSGHSRFRYTRNADGTLRLQTVRYESMELTHEMMEEDGAEDEGVQRIAVEEAALTAEVIPEAPEAPEAGPSGQQQYQSVVVINESGQEEKAVFITILDENQPVLNS